MRSSRLIPPVRRTARRWRTPPAIQHGGEAFEGAAVLDEMDPDLRDPEGRAARARLGPYFGFIGRPLDQYGEWSESEPALLFQVLQPRESNVLCFPKEANVNAVNLWPVEGVADTPLKAYRRHT